MTKDSYTLRVYRLKTIVTAVSTDESDSYPFHKLIHSEDRWNFRPRVKGKTDSNEQTRSLFLYVYSRIN